MGIGMGKRRSVEMVLVVEANQDTIKGGRVERVSNHILSVSFVYIIWQPLDGSNGWKNSWREIYENV